MMEWRKIKPCPFCGRVGSLDMWDEDGSYFIRCANSDFGCSATGPVGFSEKEAVDMWNTRVDEKEEQA